MRPAPDLDGALGMSAYATDGSPCSCVVKSSADDFVVEEVVSLDQLTKEEKPGYFPVYRVEKRSVDTMHMEAELSRALGSRLSYGGLKDKMAVAVQYVTPTSRSARPRTVARPGFVAELIGYLPAPITKGSVLGNRFEVKLRGCCDAAQARATEALDAAKQRRVPNYFGYQRFGASGTGTHLVGRAMVRRRFSDAVELLLLSPREGDDAGTRAAREAMSDGDYEMGARLLSPGQDLERMVAAKLARGPGDPVGALRGVPVRMRRLYVQAYQSFIFNRSLSLALEEGLDIAAAEDGDNWASQAGGKTAVGEVKSTREAPPAGARPMVQLPGYAFRDYGSRFDRHVSAVMAEEKVSPKDFYVKEMQEVSAEGGFRVAHLVLDEPTLAGSDDGLLLGFRLARGQYATVLLREIVKPTDPRSSGLC